MQRSKTGKLNKRDMVNMNASDLNAPTLAELLSGAKSSKKIQVPVVGGLRKVVTVSNVANTGTTLAGYAGQTLSIGQLATLLSGYFTAASAPSTGNIGGGGGSSSASIALGPGLASGGALIGAVPIRLDAPRRFIIDEADDPYRFPPPGRGACRSTRSMVFIPQTRMMT